MGFRKNMGLGSLRISRRLIVSTLSIGTLLTCLLLITAPAQAAAGVNQQINFQGRLLNSQGATVPDGYYNIEFKIYQDGDGLTAGNTTGAPAGSLKWTEDYLNANSQGVTVKNGFLSVQLGSITPFGSSIDWNQDKLWLSLNIAGTAAACTPFSSCTPDGEMIPMKRLSSTPYSLNSGLLGGLSSAQFIQMAQGVQTDASVGTNSIYINKTGSGNLLTLQSSGSDAFTLSNAGDAVFGANANHTLSVATAGAGVAGKTLTLVAGAAGSGGSVLSGGTLALQGGAGGGTNGNGGNVTIDAGVKNGTGVDGTLSLGTTTASAVNISKAGVITTIGGALTVNSTVNGLTLSSSALSVATAATGLALNAGTTGTVSIGGVSTGDVLLAGGSAATGCTINNGNGNLLCSGSLNGATLSGGAFSGGTISGGTLSATTVNSLNVAANAISTASGNLTVDANTTGTVSVGGISTGDILIGGGSGATGCTITNVSGNLACTGTLNGATISGGTLSAGSFTGGAVSGGSLTAGTFSGGTVSGGTLSATTVNTLNVSANAISTASGNLTVDANTTGTLSLGGTSTGDVLLGGGVASTGCTLTNFTGAFACTGTINTATISGGTLSGGNVSGGALSAGTFSGGTVSGGSLTATTVNGLNLSTTALSVVTAATGLTVDAGTTGTVSIGGISSGDVLLAGGSSSTGCTVNNGNGNLVCTGSINGTALSGGTFSGGTISGGTLSATTVNALNVSANAISTGAGNLTVDANTTGTLSLGATSTGDILFGGGSGSTGCTVTNASGNFACTGTINGATLSGGTLTATAVNGLNVSSTAVAVAAAATGLTLDAGTTGAVSIGGTSTGDILLGGGSGSTGCTVANATGNFACTGTITGTTLNGTTGVNTGAGAGTQRIDNSGNLLNIGNVTTSGASTFATTGATGFTFKPGTDITTAFQVQNASNARILVVDSTNRQLKVFENNGSVNYALIYYDTATTTAHYTASSGTVEVGAGAGSISVVSGASAAVTITANAASTWQTSSGTLTLQSGSASDLILSSGSSVVSINGSSVVKLGSSVGDPSTCTVGAIVYNSTTNLFRGCQGSLPAWATLGTTSPTLQTVYTASTGSTTPEIRLDTTRGTLDIQGDNAGSVGTLLSVRAGTASGLGTSLFSVTAAGVTTMQNSAGAAILTANATNNLIQVGSSTAHSTNPITFALDAYQAATAGAEPTVVNGAMYFNVSAGVFRCGINGRWQSCAINNIESSYVFEDEFLGGTTSAATGTSFQGVGALGWNVNATTSCAAAYNQTGPALTHDHPGTLRLTTNAISGNGCALTQAGTAAGTATLSQIIGVGDVFKTNVAIGAQTGTTRVGWTNQTSSTTPTSGAYWEYVNATDATRLRYCYANNTTPVCATGPVLAANTWAELEIRINSASSITFIANIGGVNTTNTTSGAFDVGSTNKLGPTTTCYASTTTALSCYIDYIQWSGYNIAASGIRN